jgi:ribosome-binding protein aMBF1 (putative translation factor)
MLKNFSSKKPESDLPEGPIEAGQVRGMNPETVLERYFKKRNDLLKLLRIYSGLSSSEVAKNLDISESELEVIENSDKPCPFQLVPKFEKIFNVDLKSLLILLGHAKGSVQKDEGDEFTQLGLAAQYSGPELTRQEKIDLEELFKLILQHIKDRKGNKSE